MLEIDVDLGCQRMKPGGERQTDKGRALLW